jgi:Rod binding domain-containing protein
MTTPSDSISPKSYLDFTGLGELRGQAQQDQGKAINQAAQQFEGLFIQMMMKSMRDAVPKDDKNQSSAKDTFEGMFDQEVSVQMAKRNALGVANYLSQAVQHHGVTPSTADVFKARQAQQDTSTGLPLHPAPAAPMSLNATQPALALPHPHVMTFDELKRKRRGGL